MDDGEEPLDVPLLFTTVGAVAAIVVVFVTSFSRSLSFSFSRSRSRSPARSFVLTTMGVFVFVATD